MAQERLVNKFLNDMLHITTQDCDRLLTSYGYELHKGGGSHRTYHKRGAKPITVVAPKQSKNVNTAYVKTIINDLRLEE